MKKVRVAKGKTVPFGVLSKIRKRRGSSNAGKYKGVKLSDFAGGKENPYSFPINTRKRAKAALSYARFAKNPNKVRRKACNKYPGLCSKKTLQKIKS